MYILKRYYLMGMVLVDLNGWSEGFWIHNYAFDVVCIPFKAISQIALRFGKRMTRQHKSRQVKLYL